MNIKDDFPQSLDTQIITRGSREMGRKIEGGREENSKRVGPGGDSEGEGEDRREGGTSPSKTEYQNSSEKQKTESQKIIF